MYVSGKWTANEERYREMLNPDQQDTRYTKAQISLMRKDKREAVATIPIGTAGDPFTYECVEDGTYRIGISDYSFDDNTGAVVYRVTRVEGESKEESAK